MKEWEVIAYDAEGAKKVERVTAANPQGAIVAAREKGLKNVRSISEVGPASEAAEEAPEEAPEDIGAPEEPEDG